MQLPPLKAATLIKRYKRFLADVLTAEGEILTLHCANTGAMTGCASPGDTVWYSTSDNPKRKHPYSWELTQKPSGEIICINTLRANTLVYEALQQRNILPLQQYDHISPEVKYGQENSRIDFLLQSTALSIPDCYVEVKSVTLVKQQIGMFPDAVTTRGQKHLRELIEVVEQGKSAVIFFACLHSATPQHQGIQQFSPAQHIDPAYAKLLTLAVQKGVIPLCYQAYFEFSRQTPVALTLGKAIPLNIE